MHVAAKRYLIATDTAYRTQLSHRSIETLARQGGALDGPEMQALAQRPYFDAILELRRADDRAKVPGARVPPLETWRPLLEFVASPDRRR